MEKQRMYKLFSIIALMFAVVALSVGFAAFQKIMNISSSAKVSLPTDDNLKLTLYGITSLDAIEDLKNEIIDYSKFSKEKAYATDLNISKFYSEYYATIDSKNLTININNVVLKEPGEGYVYYFVLRNDSDYGVYVYVSDAIKEIYSNGLSGACTAIEGTSEELLDQVCQRITLNIADSELFKGTYKLSANNIMIIPITVGYKINSNRADGKFLVDFPQVKLEFDTVPHTYNNLNIVQEDA